MKKLGLIFFLFGIAAIANAQDSSALPKKLTVNGYIKSLQTLSFDKNFKESIAGNLIHNRINIKWKPTGKITFAMELRNRLFWGEEVKLTPGFASQLRNKNEKINLQKAWINNRSLVFHSNVERLYAEYRGSSFNFRVGRQRINWGVSTTWNPNDIFNTYNFLDFDYEERPGVDGGKIQYIINDFSKAELAYSNTGTKEGNIAAFKYDMNKRGYDFQFITGWFQQQFTAGAGWAGNIKDAGFKGEIQYFFTGKDSTDHFNMTLEADYMFKKGWYLNAGLLFNKNGLYKPVNNWDTINLNISPENLMPTKWNLIVTTAKEVTPLLSANLSIVYAPGTNLLIVFPSIQYNLATDLGLNLVWQSFFAELNKQFEAVNHRAFLRLKWNF